MLQGLIDRKHAAPLVGRTDLKAGHHRRRQAPVEHLHVAGGHRVVQAHAHWGAAGGLVVAVVDGMAVCIDAADAAIGIGNAARIDYPRQQRHLASAATETFQVEGNFGLRVRLKNALRLLIQLLIHFFCTRQASAAGGTVHGACQNFVLGAGTLDIFEFDAFYTSFL